MAGVVIQGPDEQRLRAILREELDRARNSVDDGRAARSLDVFADSLWLCMADDRATLGVAVDHSGVVVCPAAVGAITLARHVMIGETRPVTDRSAHRVLQTVFVGTPTVGVVRLAAPTPDWTAALHVFDRSGHRQAVRLEVVEVDARIGTGGDGFFVDGALMVKLQGAAGQHIGGPLVTEAGEVVGVVVGETTGGELFLQPWKPLESCIDMDGRPVQQGCGDRCH